MIPVHTAYPGRTGIAEGFWPPCRKSGSRPDDLPTDPPPRQVGASELCYSGEKGSGLASPPTFV